MKTCSKCKIEKTKDNFYINPSKKDGLNNQCSSCMKEYAAKTKEQRKAYRKEYNLKNKENIKLHNSSYYSRNLESIKIAVKEYSVKNRDKIIESKRKYTRNNAASFSYRNAVRRASKLLATPTWSKNWLNKILIEEQYLIAETISMVTGIKYHVDHIIPLQGKSVSGLHCVSNLRVIPAKENLSKNNKLIEDLL